MWYIYSMCVYAQKRKKCFSSPQLQRNLNNSRYFHFLCRFFVFFNWAYNWYSLFVCVCMYVCVSLCICVCVCWGVIKIFKYIYIYILCMYNTPTFILKLNLSCLIVCLSVSLLICLFCLFCCSHSSVRPFTKICYA